MDNPRFELLSFLQANPLFSGLSASQLEQLAPFIREISVEEDEWIIHEDEISDDVYVLKSGELEVDKVDPLSGDQHCLASLTAGAVVGEVSLLDNAPRSASVRATQASQLLVLSIKELRDRRNIKDIYYLLVRNIARNLGQRMRTANTAIIDGLRKELEQTKARVAYGRLIAYTLSILSFYALLLKTMEGLHPTIPSAELGVPLIAIFAMAVILLMKKSGYPLSFYGLTLRNWKRSSWEAILFTVPILVLIIIYKWFLIRMSPNFAGQSLFNTADFISLYNHVFLHLPTLTIMLYLLFAPMHEVIVRGALQSSLQKLLSGPYKVSLAIVLSNILFSVTQIHVSIALGLALSLPGFFWGWLYSRQHNLVGVSISHMLVGTCAFFVIGVR